MPDVCRVSVPSPTIIELVVTPVTKPFALTVMLGIEVWEPKVPTLLLTVARVVTVLSEVTSPVKFGILVVDVAVPLKLDAVTTPTTDTPLPTFKLFVILTDGVVVEPKSSALCPDVLLIVPTPIVP